MRMSKEFHGMRWGKLWDNVGFLYHYTYKHPNNPHLWLINYQLINLVSQFMHCHQGCPQRGKIFGSSTFPQISSSIWRLGLSWNLVIGLFHTSWYPPSTTQWLGKIRRKWSSPPSRKNPGDSTAVLYSNTIVILITL